MQQNVDVPMDCRAIGLLMNQLSILHDIFAVSLSFLCPGRQTAVVLPPCWEMKWLVTQPGLEHLSALWYFSWRICFYSINTVTAMSFLSAFWEAEHSLFKIVSPECSKTVRYASKLLSSKFLPSFSYCNV